MGQEIKLKGKLKAYIMMPLVLTVLLAAMDVWLYVISPKAGVIGTVFAAVYFLILVAVYQRNKPVILNELIDFATQYGLVQKRLLNEFEIPYSLLDSNGRILWMNKAFAKATGRDKHYNRSIASVFPSITKDLLAKSDEQDVSVTLEDTIYRASIKKVYFNDVMADNGMIEAKDSRQFLAVIYLHDETLLNYYIKETENMQLVAGLIYIDNFEEVMEDVEEVKQSLLLALVDRKINKYFSSVDALIKKIEKDKYFIVFKQQYLEKLEEDKYGILDEVKAIKAGNKMAVTISIGVGSGCKEYMKNYEYARTSIELALGRGGDQVVHKTKDSVYYFGGNSRQVEKNTRVKARVKALALREIMMIGDRFFVMGHKIADIDSFGAAVGIYCAGRQLGKKVQIVLDEVTTSLRPVREQFSTENGYPEDMFITSHEALETYDYHTGLVVVDTNKPGYTECPQLLNKSKSIVVFDHHRQGQDIIKNAVLSYIEPYASSACEMIAEVLQYFDEDIKLSNIEADSIYAGILIDTNNFMTKTGVRTFEAAAYLKRCGADVTRVRKMLRNDMNAYKARAEAVRHAQVYRGSFAISICPADNIESPTVACAQAANELLNIIGIRAAFVLTEYHEKIYISARSIDEINVQRIMERLGGGGHLNTAGAQLTDCSMEEACKTIQNTLDEMIEEGDIK